MVARHHGKKRPDAGSGQHEKCRAKQNAADQRRGPDKRPPLPKRTEQDGGRGFPLRLNHETLGNAPQACEHGDKGKGIQREDPGRAEGCDEEASQRRADRPGEVEADAVERDGRRGLVPGDQILQQGLPAGQMNRRAQAQQEEQQEKLRGLHRSPPGHDGHQPRRDHHPELGTHQQAPAVHQIGQRPARNTQQESGKAGRCLDKTDEQGRIGQRGHQPGRRRSMHDGSQVGKEVGDPEIAELRLTERLHAGTKELPTHGCVGYRRALIPSFSHVALAPSTSE